MSSWDAGKATSFAAAHPTTFAGGSPHAFRQVSRYLGGVISEIGAAVLWTHRASMDEKRCDANGAERGSRAVVGMG